MAPNPMKQKVSDMPKRPTKPLTGLCVLMAEDNYHIARESSWALSEAGAEVIGPFSNTKAAMTAIEHRPMDCAVLDLNLDGGPRFELARMLHQRGVPIVFFTGYGCEIVPPDLADIPCVEKPLEDRHLIDAVRAICRPET